MTRDATTLHGHIRRIVSGSAGQLHGINRPKRNDGIAYVASRYTEKTL